ncbi:MAG: efflux RND transporter periplasmic adaptor subunit [Deltaproteobacteria bacterium]|nr:efflux RND transporter periplasmic adaptor subunit [Deltaproteobacteria bacterium]MBW2691582.1 efflux RND transporter periplasmic adaptor subunit [Deltaproteobacteria bacterium]
MSEPIRSISRLGRTIFVTLLLANTAVWVGCGEEPAPAAPVARPVKILTIDAQGAVETFEYSGTIAAAQHSEMAFEVPGKITDFPVVEGQVVKQGDLLVRIDPRDMAAAADVDTARVRLAKAEYERMKKLFEADVASVQELDRAKRSYEVMVARSQGSAKGLEDTELFALFDGIVAKKLVKDFENVQAKQPVLILQDTTNLEIDVTIPEADAVKAATGVTLEERTARVKPIVIVTSLPGRSFPAQITEFNTTADPVTRTFRVTLRFDPPDDVGIKPGMTATVRIHIKPDSPAATGLSSVSIPASAAITDETGQAFVWVVDPAAMTVKRTPVQLGDLSGSRVFVTSGLAAGQQIAISGVHRLRDGMLIRRQGS